MNAYALICPDTKQSVLIDPGAEPETLLNDGAQTQTPIAILLTHAHHDHIGALADMREQLNIPVYIHPADSHMGVAADKWFADGDTFSRGKQHAANYPYPRPYPRHGER